MHPPQDHLELFESSPPVLLGESSFSRDDIETTSGSSSHGSEDVCRMLTSNSPPLLIWSPPQGQISQEQSLERLKASIEQVQSDIASLLYRRPTLEDLDALPRMQRDLYEKRQLLRELETRAGCADPSTFNRPLQVLHRSHATLSLPAPKPAEPSGSRVPNVRVRRTQTNSQLRRERDGHRRYATTMAPLFSSIAPTESIPSPLHKLTSLLHQVKPNTTSRSKVSSSEKPFPKIRDVITDDVFLINPVLATRSSSFPKTQAPSSRTRTALSFDLAQSSFISRPLLTSALIILVLALSAAFVWDPLTRYYTQYHNRWETGS